jgi:hypothetical protein
MSTFQNIYVKKNLEVEGNLTVTGVTTSINSENVLIADRFMVLNGEYTSAAPQTAGFAVNYAPLKEFAVTNFTQPATIHVSSDLTADANVAAGKFIIVAGSDNNNGVYEIASLDANTITINTTPAASYLSGSSVTTESITCTAAAVSISVMQTNTTGDFQSGKGTDSTALSASFRNLSVQGGTTSNATQHLTADTAQLLLGSDGIATIDVLNTSNAVYTIPDGTLDGNFVFHNSTDTLTNKTLQSCSLNGGTVSTLDFFSVQAETGVNSLEFKCIGTLDAHYSLGFDIKSGNRKITLDGDLTTVGDVSVGAALTTVAVVNIGSTLSTVGAVSVGGALTTVGDVSVGAALTTVGDFSVGAALTTTDVVNIGSTLATTGAVSIGSGGLTTGLGAITTGTQPVTISSGLSVLNSDVRFNNGFVAEAYCYFYGAVSTGGAVTTKGDFETVSSFRTTGDIADTVNLNLVGPTNITLPVTGTVATLEQTIYNNLAVVSVAATSLKSINTFTPDDGDTTVTLPLVNNAIGKTFKFTHNGSVNDIIITGETNKIEGSTTFTLGPNQHASLTCDGYGWRINL